MPEPIVVAEKAAKSYGDLVALEPLDLEVEVGQSVALIGHNGSGKSTFLRMAAGLLEPTARRVEIAGWPVGSTRRGPRPSFLPDNPVLYDDLSLREHVEYVSPHARCGRGGTIYAGSSPASSA